MPTFLSLLLDWSEVWATLIPLFFLLANRKQPSLLKPIILYLWLALFINITADLIRAYNKYFHTRISNTFLYDLHSLVRFACFVCFFVLLKEAFFTTLKKALIIIFALFVFINFYFIEKFHWNNAVSGNLLAAESFVLLIYCMLYYLYQLQGEGNELSGKKDFWIVTGLSIYVVINFFVFLFYNPMFNQNQSLTAFMWNVHNIAYIFFCMFIAKAFYVPARH